MQTQTKFRFLRTLTPPPRHPASDSRRAPRLIAAAGAVFVTVLGMAAVIPGAPATPTAQHTSATQQRIHGIPVFDLPAVNVHATVSGLKSNQSVASDAQPVTFGSSLLNRLNDQVDAPTLIGSQLAMPYYSFASKFGRISKD